MHQIGIGFQGIDGPIAGERVTARGLHGLLYNVLKQFDQRKATWLHNHRAPKPYTVAPYYDSATSSLAGVRLTALSAETTALFVPAWEMARLSGRQLHLGSENFTVQRVESIPGPSFKALSTLQPKVEVALRFLSPTSFRQGPGDLPLPLPRNVFQRPFEVWQSFAPRELQIPGDWLEWCEQNVFVTAHQIETATVHISWNEPFTGFVGAVSFRAKDDAVLYRSVWQGLAALAPYCGVGRKTTMGMGAVEQIGTLSSSE